MNGTRHLRQAGSWRLALALLVMTVGFGSAHIPARAQSPAEDAAFARKVFGDVNAPRPVDVGDGETRMLLPVEIAAARTDAAGARMLRALAAAGADVNRKDPEGRAAVHVAAMFQAAENIRVLHELGADLDARDADGDTPLHIAVLKGDAALAGLLLSLGARPEVTNRAGLTPLAALLSQADPLLRFGGVSAGAMADLVSRLLQAGADPDRPHPTDGRTPLMFAVALPAPAALPIVRALLAGGADPNRADHAGRTALHHAIEAGTGHGNSIAAKERASADVVRLLLAAGADPDHRDAAGRTPLFPAAERACSYGPDETAIFDLLIAAGADPAIRDAQGRAALEPGECSFLRRHLDAPPRQPVDVAGERVDGASLKALDPDTQRLTVIGIIRRVLERDVTGRRRLRGDVGRLASMTGLKDAAEAKRRAELFDRYLDHVLGVVTWKEEGPGLILRIGKKLEVPLGDADVAAVLVPVFGSVPDGSSDRALRAEYYWAESWRDIFRLLAAEPTGWRWDEGRSRLDYSSSALAEKVARLQEDARAFATAFTPPSAP